MTGQGLLMQGDQGCIPVASISNGVFVSNCQKASLDQQMLKSWTIIKERRFHMFMRAVHPGIVLKDEPEEIGITPTEFARQIDVPPNRISHIISGKRSVTGDTALRLGHWFDTDPQFWINLQAQYELAVAGKETGDVIKRLPTKATLPPQAEQPRLV
jgi:addiction module HigA family antidote